MTVGIAQVLAHALPQRNTKTRNQVTGEGLIISGGTDGADKGCG